MHLDNLQYKAIRLAAKTAAATWVFLTAFSLPGSVSAQYWPSQPLPFISVWPGPWASEHLQVSVLDSLLLLSKLSSA